MDIRTRRVRTAQIHDENQHPVLKGKTNALPGKRQGLAVRGALGELNDNVQRICDPGKGVIEEKKAPAKCVARIYSHVQSKIDTGLVQNNSVRPLRREESTAGHAVRAAGKPKPTAKKPTNENVQIKVEIKKTAKKIVKKDDKVIAKDEVVSLNQLRLESTPDSEPLPSEIEDIDARDKDCPFLLSVYITDIYNYLSQLEDKYIIEGDYLKNQAVITGAMRAMLIDWLAEVQQQFALVLETFHLTISIIDRYLQATTNVERNKLQLVGVTAMFIASKYEEIYAPQAADFIYVTDNAYTKADMYQCERDILSKLNFCLAKPTPLQFLRRYVKAARGKLVNHHLGKYFVELCFVNYSMVEYKPSELAAASVCLSIHLLSEKPIELIWNKTMIHYSNYRLNHILPIMAKIAQIVVKVEDSKFKAVYKKYALPCNAKVSTLPHLKGHLIKELATMAAVVNSAVKDKS